MKSAYFNLLSLSVFWFNDESAVISESDGKNVLKYTIEYYNEIVFLKKLIIHFKK